MKNRNIIAAYLRCSSDDQSTEAQRADLERYLEREGFDLSRVQWFIDEGTTGDNLDRPAFEELDRLIANGAVATVVVWKLDRLSRSMIDGLTTVSRWLESGVRFVSTTQAFDFRGTIGKMVAALCFGFAEIEQQSRRERQAVGIQHAKANGTYKGRAKGATKAGVDPSRAKELRSKGLTFREIAAALGVSAPTARSYCMA
ncbi:DNA-invertase hin [Rubripirellula obstinata]|uniref:DNA-invertase hin n=1 Tax=Rubripirellula obstinata TaxID=406547 RepID=A0A5B1CRN5_9BACT|nr:recombinase family protein [Rubripirellula obstinata]KAA1262300.1 DNA-invertase hin [Rubripirellula obstinata]